MTGFEPAFIGLENRALSIELQGQAQRVQINCAKCNAKVKRFGKNRRGFQRFRCKTCRKTFTESHDTQMNKLKPEKRDNLFSAFREGLSIRQSMRLSGVSNHTACKYYKAFTAQSGKMLCPCGQVATHKGWCTNRFLRSENRRRFMSIWHPRLDFSEAAIRRRLEERQRRKIERSESLTEFYPYLKTETPGTELIVKVNSMVPRDIPKQFRSDICQELLMAVIGGDISVEQVPAVIKKYAREVYRQCRMPDRFISLDLNGDIDFDAIRYGN